MGATVISITDYKEKGSSGLLHSLEMVIILEPDTYYLRYHGFIEGNIKQVFDKLQKCYPSGITVKHSCSEFVKESSNTNIILNNCIRVHVYFLYKDAPTLYKLRSHDFLPKVPACDYREFEYILKHSMEPTFLHTAIKYKI